MSQASEIQMLEVELAALDPSVDVIVRVDLINRLAWTLSDTDSKRALSLSQTAFELANASTAGRAAYQAGIAYSLRTQGYVHSRLGDYALGLSQLLRAEELFEGLGCGDGLADVFDGIAGIYFHLNHLPEALNYTHRQLEAAQHIEDKRRVANAYNNMGVIFDSMGEVDRGAEMFLRNLHLATEPGYERIEALALLNLANIYWQTGNAEQALAYILRGLEIIEGAGFDVFEIFARGISGQIYKQLGKVEEAMRFLHSAHTLSQAIGSKYNEAESLLNLGQVYGELGQSEQALAYLRECVAIATSINAAMTLQSAHQQLAMMFERQGDFATALEHLKAYHALRERSFDEKADQRLKVLQVVHDTDTAKKEALIAQLRTQQLEKEVVERKQAELALQEVQTQLELEVDQRTAELRNTVVLLQKEIEERERAEAEIQSMIATLEQRVASRTEELATFFDLTILAGQADSLESVFEQVLPRIMEVTRSRAICIHLLSEERNALRLAGQLNFSRGFQPPQLLTGWGADFDHWLLRPNDPLVTFNLFGANIVPVELRFAEYRTYLGAQIKVGSQIEGLLSCYRFTDRGFGVDEIALVTALAEQLGMTLESQRLRMRAEEVAVLQERQRLARDLHDSVTQTLYSLSLFSRAGQEAAEDGDAVRLNSSLRELERNTLHALREMRLLLYELRPADLEHEGLGRAIQLRLNTVERRVGLELDVKWQDLPPMPAKFEAELYHIIVEALNNVVKHASARRLTVHLNLIGERLHLCIADDGLGFERLAANAKGGHGLRNIQERVSRLQGTLSIKSRPGAGTRIEVTMPFGKEVLN